ncbi:hypothetical protein FBU30_009979 [Linnemannia zychae]|nr:hypothetical protein FBU30_009979 [Linnemannia zychae]
MAANDLPINLILGRSVNDGFLQRDDPKIAQQQLARPNGTLLDGVTKTTTNINNSARHTQRLPLSQSAAIFNHKIGHSSTTAQNYTTQPRLNNTINVLNNSSRRGAHTASSTSKASTVARGYGLADFSSEESDFDSDLSDNEQQHLDHPLKQSYGNGAVASQHVFSANNPAYYVAHITGRMDPWEAQMQQIQDLGKDLAPEIAEEIAKDFDTIAQRPIKSSVKWIRDDDIVQKLNKLSMETASIKDKRKKEIDNRNQSMKKGIEDCMAQIKDERETIIRIKQEAERKIQEEKDRIAKEAEEKKKAEIAKKEEQEKKAAEAAAAAVAKAKKEAEEAESLAAAKSSSAFASEAAKQEWEKYIKVLEYIKTVVMPSITSNPALKKTCGNIRREIVGAIGRVTNKREEILRIATELDTIFKDTMRQGEGPYYWAMNVTAKKLVKQAETEALVKSAPAFPLAHIAVLLFTNHNKFLDVLMARFAKKCIYVTPIYVPKAPNDTADDYMIKLGFKKKDSGFETEAQYDARQCAIFTLYCAILQTTPPVGNNIHSIDNGWRWMARILNMPPRPITPALIQVCGNQFMRTYRNQATKTLQLLMNKFIPLIPKQGIAGTTRLKTLLEQFLKTGNIPVAEGQQYDP